MKSRWASSRVFLLCSFFQNDRRPILKQLEILRLCDVDNPGKVSRLNPVRGFFCTRGSWILWQTAVLQEIVNGGWSLADWFRADASLSASRQRGSRVEESLFV